MQYFDRKWIRLGVLLGAAVLASGFGKGKKPVVLEEHVAEAPVWGVSPEVVAINPTGTMVVRATKAMGLHDGVGGMAKGLGKSLLSGVKVSAQAKDGDRTIASASVEMKRDEKYGGLPKEWHQAVDAMNAPGSGLRWRPHYPGAIQAADASTVRWIGADNVSDFRTVAFSADGAYVAVGGGLSRRAMEFLGLQEVADCQGRTFWAVEPTELGNPMFREGDITTYRYLTSPPPGSATKECVAATRVGVTQQFIDRQAGNILVIDSNGARVSTIASANVGHLVFRPDNTLRAYYGPKGGISWVDIWRPTDVRTGEEAWEARSLPAEWQPMECVAKATGIYEYQTRYFSAGPGGRHVAMAQFKDGVFSRSQFDLVVCDESGAELWRLPIGKSLTYSTVAFSGDGQRMLIAGSGHLRVFQTANGEEISDLSAVVPLANHWAAASLDEKGTRVVVADKDDNFAVVDIDSAEVRHQGKLAKFASPLVLTLEEIRYFSAADGQFKIVAVKLPTDQ